MRHITHLALMLLIQLPSCLLAQTPVPRPVIDFACVSTQSNLQCGVVPAHDFFGKALPEMPIYVSLARQATYTPDGNAGQVTLSCLIKVITNPPPVCISQMYSSADVNSLLVAQEARARRRELALCRAVAVDVNRCPAEIQP